MACNEILLFRYVVSAVPSHRTVMWPGLRAAGEASVVWKIIERGEGRIAAEDTRELSGILGSERAPNPGRMIPT